MSTILGMTDWGKLISWELLKRLNFDGSGGIGNLKKN